jgi:hypothetical protein
MAMTEGYAVLALEAILNKERAAPKITDYL